jgi:hypothetical protein
VLNVGVGAVVVADKLPVDFASNSNIPSALNFSVTS